MANALATMDADGYKVEIAPTTSIQTVTFKTANKYNDKDIIAVISGVSAGTIKANAPTVTSGSASIETGTIKTSSTATDYYVILNTADGSAMSNAGVNEAGFMDVSFTAQSAAAAVPVSGNGDKTYIKAGVFNNAATADVSYAENTAAATTIPAEGYLYLNEGYYPNTKISLGHMIPDDENYTNAGTAQILSGYEAYDTNGKKLIGTIPTQTLYADEGSLTGTNVTLGTTNNGISVSGSGTVGINAGYTTGGTKTSNVNTKYISGVTIPTPASGVNTFTVTASGTTYTWKVDSNGNVWIE